MGICIFRDNKISESSLEYFIKTHKIPNNTKTLDLTAYGIFIDDYEYFYSLTELSELNLNGSIINDLKYITHLKKLNKLNLKLCINITDFTYLNLLYNLNHLDLSSTKIESNFLLNLPHNLISLNLSNTKIDSINNLPRLKYLTTLNLYNCSKIKDFNPLTIMNNLYTLNLKNTGFNNLKIFRGKHIPINIII